MSNGHIGFLETAGGVETHVFTDGVLWLRTNKSFLDAVAAAETDQFLTTAEAADYLHEQRQIPLYAKKLAFDTETLAQLGFREYARALGK